MSNPIEVLNAFASDAKKKILPCKIFDANVSSSIMNDSTHWNLELVSGYVFSRQVRMHYRKRRVVILASEEYISVSVEGTLNVGLCSINRVNSINFVKTHSDLTVAGDTRWPVFLQREAPPQDSLRAFLASHILHDAVSLFVSSPRESLHICRGAILVYSLVRSPETLHRGIDLLCDLVAPRAKARIEGLESLPPELHALIPLVEKWAEGDDGWREDKLRKASKSELEQLIQGVEPHLVAMNSYLDIHDDEAAHALGSLAECAMEARLQMVGNRLEP